MSKDSMQKTLDLNQIQLIPLEDLIYGVLTLKEASGILNVAESTLRTRVLKGDFESWEYRKAGATILFTRKAIELRSGNFRLRQREKSK